MQLYFQRVTERIWKEVIGHLVLCDISGAGEEMLFHPKFSSSVLEEHLNLVLQLGSIL